jgi:hypothetical protein
MRKLYKLYQALVLEALVDEVPMEEVIKVYFPCGHMSAEAAFHRYQKDVKDLQVPYSSCHTCCHLCCSDRA